ncbi:MAG: glycosyltransferase family 2 protein [Desulfuromonadaceae bacterium]|nr:glycosyltransferase family 2 protein [Desulfuromonadaceae bacterium]MDD5104176.1 glycosyltransferase family 2 protein [Desulfuromonadaceae bacterium]
MLPQISIVTPSLNQAEYLEECIESVLGQGYPLLEYVIMDGGSTDGSVEIIKKYEKHLTYWQSRPDGGQYKAINEGFQHTSGEIMAWLNSDDKYHPLAFAKVASVFEDHPEVGWLTGRATFWDASGNLDWVDCALRISTQMKFLKGHFDKPYIQQESTFWRRSLWGLSGASLDGTALLAGDLELWCRFFRHTSLYTVDTMLGGYRFHDGQRASVYAEEYLKECTEYIKRERHLCNCPLDLLSSPPASLSVTRERLAAYIGQNDIISFAPNRTGCWCEYTEDLIAITNTMLHERRIEGTPFWQNEISLFSLVKPRAAWLLGDTINKMVQSYDQLDPLLTMGQKFAACDNYSEALGCYRQALDIAPFSAQPAKALVLCLEKSGNREECLRMLSSILAVHAHDSGVVQAAVLILTRCGAIDLARGVCSEYLMSNPHDEVIQSMSISLEPR